ncbi:MAG TPA: hypothetical protein VM469_15160 [Pseudoxanthomonas sp.]|nr:hypothetical protein [Pseudoxanthomonas sp.]
MSVQMTELLFALLLAVDGGMARPSADEWIGSKLAQISVEQDATARYSKIDELVVYVRHLGDDQRPEVSKASVDGIASLLQAHDAADAMAAASALSCAAKDALPALEKASVEYALPTDRVLPLIARSSSAADEIDTAIKLIHACSESR